MGKVGLAYPAVGRRMSAEEAHPLSSDAAHRMIYAARQISKRIDFLTATYIYLYTGSLLDRGGGGRVRPILHPTVRLDAKVDYSNDNNILR
jgi:hypothetical protein